MVTLTGKQRVGVQGREEKKGERGPLKKMQQVGGDTSLWCVPIFESCTNRKDIPIAPYSSLPTDCET